MIDCCWFPASDRMFGTKYFSYFHRRPWRMLYILGWLFVFLSLLLRVKPIRQIKLRCFVSLWFRYFHARCSSHFHNIIYWNSLSVVGCLTVRCRCPCHYCCHYYFRNVQYLLPLFKWVRYIHIYSKTPYAFHSKSFVFIWFNGI